MQFSKKDIKKSVQQVLDKKEALDLETQAIEDKKDRRGTIRKLFGIRHTLLKDESLHESLSFLIELLRWEFHYKRLHIVLFCNCMWEIFDYAKYCCDFIEREGDELRKMKNWLCATIQPVSNFLAKKNKKSRDFFDIDGVDFLEEIKEGTFTSKTILCYTHWVLCVIPKEPELVEHIQIILRPFETYVRDFCKPRLYKEHYKNLVKEKDSFLISAVKNLMRRALRGADALTQGTVSKFSTALLDIPENSVLKRLDPEKDELLRYDSLQQIGIPLIMWVIDDIIEDYIEVLKPSSYFLNTLLLDFDKKE